MGMIMDILDWFATERLTVVAIFVGPIFAILIARFLQNNKEKRERKLWVFKTLMVTRGTHSERSSRDHVRALNLIDIEFSGKKEVLVAWRKYHHIISHVETPLYTLIYDPDAALIDLLHSMSEVLGYKFKKEYIRRLSRVPRGYADKIRDEEQRSNLMLEALTKMLDGKNPPRIAVVGAEPKSSSPSPHSDGGER